MKIRIRSSKPYKEYGLLEWIRIFIINTIILIIIFILNTNVLH